MSNEVVVPLRSNNGRFISNSGREREYFESKIMPIPECGCWLWTGGIFPNGYGAAHIHYSTLGAHRLSWEIHYGNIPNGLSVLHRCDTKSCVNPHHLFLGTARDNAIDASNKGVLPNGEKHWITTLTQEQVMAIRNDNRSQVVIGKEYGVHPTTICNIRIHKTWRR